MLSDKLAKHRLSHQPSRKQYLVIERKPTQIIIIVEIPKYNALAAFNSCQGRFYEIFPLPTVMLLNISLYYILTGDRKQKLGCKQFPVAVEVIVSRRQLFLLYISI